MKYYMPTKHSLFHNAYTFLWACGYVYGREVLKGMDWLGNRLIYLIDNSSFFAGVVWTYAVMTAWELLTR